MGENKYGLSADKVSDDNPNEESPALTRGVQICGTVFKIFNLFKRKSEDNLDSLNLFLYLCKLYHYFFIDVFLNLLSFSQTSPGFYVSAV